MHHFVLHELRHLCCVPYVEARKTVLSIAETDAARFAENPYTDKHDIPRALPEKNMAKTHRVSVPLTPEMERKLKKISAENGRSVAANFAELAQAGAQNSAVERELSALREALKTEQPCNENVVEGLARLRTEVRDFASKQAAAQASFVEKKEHGSGLFLPEKSARLLFGEALFSSALASEILLAELPGAPPKPAIQHLRNARQKSNAALENFLKDAGWQND